MKVFHGLRNSRLTWFLYIDSEFVSLVAILILCFHVQEETIV